MAEVAVLGFLQNNEQIVDSGEFAAEQGISHEEIVNVIKSLNGFGFVDAQHIKKERWQLTAEGKTYAAKGSPEFQLFMAIPPEGISRVELQKKLGDSVFKVGSQQAVKNKWVEIRKAQISGKVIRPENRPPTAEGKNYALNGSQESQVFTANPPVGISLVELQKIVGDSVLKRGCQQAIKYSWVEMEKTEVSRKIEHVDDNVKAMLLRINDGEDLNQEDIDALKRRKLISPQIWKGYSVKKGPNYSPKRKKIATDLTRENLSGDWRSLELKEYNVSAKGVPVEGGHLHPLLKVRQETKRILLQMGFQEMSTYNHVESSFWNFDALFQPQQHPARDSHDTFFLREPSTTKTLPEDYVERVKQIHESGGHGSRGYGYDWKREEANKNLLRTHTTAVSSRMLYALAKKPFEAQKYYSVDRVFRNEAVDRTHLAEFHQIEGLICDRGLSLGDLKGVLHDFFSRLGMSKLRFKPAYNPYTEPSMEIFGYHEGLKKWVEVGNSGMFRPEMLLPMGLPEDVRVIAWGLSLERPTMILYGIDNIRDLFGHKVDLGLIKSNGICRIGLQ